MPWDEVNPAFVDLVAETQGERWYKYVFASACRYVEEQTQRRIVIGVDATVPQRSAIGAPSDDRRKYIIMINPLDVQAAPDLVKLRIAHELGHLCCNHEGECRRLAEMSRGNVGAAAQWYSHYRQQSENEAEVFALNLLFAKGPVLERDIMSDEEFDRQVIGGRPLVAASGMNPGMAPLESILNRKSFRERMRLQLRRQGHLLAPRPILCKSLREVLPRFQTFVDSRKVAEAVHQDYRDKLRRQTPSVQSTCDPACDFNMDGVCPE